MIPEALEETLVRSIDSYADRLRGKGVREILNSDYEAPSENIDDDWLLADPNAQEFINFWKDAMKSWRQTYGDEDGYREFHNYWSLSGVSGHENKLSGAKTAYEVFLGDDYAAVRDRFGLASESQLREQSVYEIGMSSTLSRVDRYQSTAEESQLAKDLNQTQGS